jgi:DNA-binding SARP family transcriptional activator
LALLAMGGERGTSRERIQLHLWPDSSPDRAGHALDQLLYATRRDLGYDSVLSGAGDLRLNPAVIRADTWAFDDAIRNARWHDAVEVYAGPLLDGFHLAREPELERWVDAERARYEQQDHRALEALAAEAASRSDFVDAVRWWRRRAATDPLCVPVALELMRALAAADDRAGAIQHARIYQQLVKETLQLGPDPAVQALANELAAATGTKVKSVKQRPFAAMQPAPVETEDESSPSAEPEPERVSIDIPAAVTSRARPSRRKQFVGAAASVIAFSLIALALARLPSHTASATVPAFAGNPRGTSERAGDPVMTAVAGTSDMEARELYLRARQSWDKRTKPALEKAVVLYRNATERDPQYAAAYAGLAESYAMLGYFGFAPADAMFPKAKAAAERALELNPADGDAYAALGQALAWEHAWNESEAAYRRGIRIAPRNPTVHQWYALMLAYVGRAREAVEQTAEASRLDPLSVQINNMYGAMLYNAGDLQGALRQFRRTVNAEPDSAWVRQNPWVLSNYSHVEAAAGHHAEALRLIQRALQVDSTHPRLLLELAHVYILAGDSSRARAAFARADSTHPQFAIDRALLYAQLGDLDNAFAGLEKVDEWPLPALIGINSGPDYARLRSDPRFEIIRRRLRLPINAGSSVPSRKPELRTRAPL